MSQAIQTREKHTKYDPWFHFFLVPVTFLLFVWSTIKHFQLRTVESFFVLAAFFMLLILVFKVRVYSLKVQDRVIRLEERMRLQTLGNEALRARIPEFTVGQLIALRFASDGELPVLAMKALDEKLTPKQIKAAIQIWRGDYVRI